MMGTLGIAGNLVTWTDALCLAYKSELSGLWSPRGFSGVSGFEVGGWGTGFNQKSQPDGVFWVVVVGFNLNLKAVVGMVGNLVVVVVGWVVVVVVVVGLAVVLVVLTVVVVGLAVVVVDSVVVVLLDVHWVVVVARFVVTSSSSVSSSLCSSCPFCKRLARENRSVLSRFDCEPAAFPKYQTPRLRAHNFSSCWLSHTDDK
jgi:hypothetical protein